MWRRLTNLISRLQVDVIALTVLECNSENVIMAGEVHRSAGKPDVELSVGMRLWQRGITYHSDGSRFEPLGAGDDLDVLASRGVGGRMLLH
jgi:hypothetical protein